MKVAEIKKGQKVKNFYGETLTVLEVVDFLTIRTMEDRSNLYHYSKLTVNGQTLSL